MRVGNFGSWVAWLHQWSIERAIKKPDLLRQKKKLLQAVGWQQNKETGQWVENRNVIDDRISPPYWSAHTSQSFNWIQFASVNYKNQLYHVLLFEKPSGKYKNEQTREDWEPDTRTCFFIMSADDFVNVRKLVDDKSGLSIKISSNLWGYVSDPNRGEVGFLNAEVDVLPEINRCLESPDKSGECLIMNSRLSKGRTMIRFLLPASCYLVDNFIKTAYFEVTQAEFKKLLE